MLQQLKTGFKWTTNWEKYWSEIATRAKNNNLNYFIDPTFEKANRLFALSLENKNHRKSCSNYYTPKVEIKDWNVLIYSKSFFEIPVKNSEETCDKIIEVSRNNDYTTRNTLR